ncbi:uncharacterized protein BP5553_09718 [Venustampulla echinocandica]|uniref:Plasmid pRiA4b Orf3-like domain-containing protein n=1 Tax=Venustampulla echinocandica TaxID=2656787 RepID=A0A370TBT7_9HELO|nr:uncharacterized protein BP5553_09718 [Venustampulla echinocandica]RDL31509.1 hypothetical protein BP5553_09718 [Venustampulla echinocandica]
MPKAAKPRTTNRLGLFSWQGTASTARGLTKAGKPNTTTAERKVVKPTNDVADTGEVATASESKDPKPSPSPSLVEDYLLLVRLSEACYPTISRLLSVPSDLTFAELHEVFEVVFRWTNLHGYSFDVSKLLEEDEPSKYFPGSVMKNDAQREAKDVTLAGIYDNDEYKDKVEVSHSMHDHGGAMRDHEITFLGRGDPAMRKAIQISDDMKVVCLGDSGHPRVEERGSFDGSNGLKKLFTIRGGIMPKEMSGESTVVPTATPEDVGTATAKGEDPDKWDIVDVNRALSERFK